MPHCAAVVLCIPARGGGGGAVFGAAKAHRAGGGLSVVGAQL